MNIIVSKVYDIERFAWFMHLKYGFDLSYIKMLSTCINEKDKYSFINLTEEEVRYLQATNSCRDDHKYICKLKIVSTKMALKRKQSIPPYLDNERTSCNEPKEGPFNAIINSIKQLDMKQNQFEFKPFDQVLVRYDGQSEWNAGIYSRTCKNIRNETVHVCVGGGLPYNECLPYNKDTAHLIGTTKPYEPPQPKEYHVWTSGTFNEWMTEDEFQNFITTAVIHNKDITDFHVLRVKP